MKQKLLSFILTAALILISLPPLKADASHTPSPSQEILEKGTYEEGQVIVTLATSKQSALTKEGTTFFDSGISVENVWDFGDADVLGDSSAEKDFLEDKTLYVSKVSSDKYTTEELIEELEKQAYVVSAEPDYYQKKMEITDDAFTDSQWYLDGSGKFSTSSKGVRYSGAKNISQSKTPVVAVVDTGIDYTHEDIREHMWVNPYGSLPGVYGYDFSNHDEDPMDEDSSSHGTHCAGTIGALSGNGKGITGISKNVKLMALKIFGASEKASGSAIIGAFNYIYQAQQLGVNITAVNCSWGGGPSSSTMVSLINKIGAAGALFIFASGNDGINVDTHSSTKKQCPYDISSSYIIKTGATDISDSPAGYSNYGASTVDLFAPGSQILSTLNGQNFIPSIYTEKQRESICSFYSSCADADFTLYAPEDVGQTSPDTVYNSITHSGVDFFGNTKDGSLCVKTSAPDSTNSTLLLYMDVTDLRLDSSKTYYVSYDMGYKRNNIMSWGHYNRRISPDSSQFVTFRGRQYLRITNMSGPFYSYPVIYIDNPAVSVANLDISSFGKYGFSTGTSMSAPLVTGAAALMSSHFTKDSALQRRERLLSCVRPVSTLYGKCRTKGILDMSKIPSSKVTVKPRTVTKKKIKVKKIKLNKKKATLRYKKKLKLKATVTPKNATNKKVKWSSSKKKYATVSKSGVVRPKKKGIGHTVKIYAKAKDGSGKKAYCKVKIKKKKKKK